MIGSGKINSLIKLMPNVFFITYTKLSSARNSLKFARPTQGASEIGLTMLYSLKAIIMPYIGM
ncbi:hypothetical protein D3C76_1016230 [compost metagenome]